MQVFSRNEGFLSNLSDARNFSLGDPTVICRILSDHLYSNKIGSIVRELSANAIDAHRMSGNESKPFLVHLPSFNRGLFSQKDSCFSIRDFGPGLPEEGIYALYTSYGASSKREDSFQIGGFGIGSKSPFAYTDTFEVMSWHCGRKSQYVCFQDDAGSPKVKKLSEVESGEPSGLKVTFAVASEMEAEAFAEECKCQYFWYRLKPDGNYDRAEPEIVYENEWGMCVSTKSVSPIWRKMPGSSRFGGNGSERRAVVNNALYGLSELYSSSVLKRECEPFENCLTVLKVDGSSVDVAASREELAFTSRTESAVAEVSRKFNEKCASDLLEAFGADFRKSKLEAWDAWRKKDFNFAFLTYASKETAERFVEVRSFAREYSISTMLPIDGRALWNLLLGEVRGYEISAVSSYASGVSSVSKMTKTQTCSDGSSAVVPNFKHVRKFSPCGLLADGTADDWRLSVPEHSDFRIVFVRKNELYKNIADLARRSAEKLCNGSVVHVYAADAEERKRILSILGDPSEERIIDCSGMKIEPKPRTVSAASLAKRELVKARLVSFKASSLSRAVRSDLVASLRTASKDEWVSVESIEKKLASGCCAAVTSGTELSEKAPVQIQGMVRIFSRICGEEYVPRNWVVLNESAYRKYCSLGGTPIGEDDALKWVESFCASAGISAETFENWSLITKRDDSIHFSWLDSSVDFGHIASRHPDHPAAKAWSEWKGARDIAQRIFCNTDAISKALFSGVDGIRISSRETADRIAEEAGRRLRLDEVVRWVKSNPIITLLSGKWAVADSEREMNARILEEYLRWE